MSTPENGHTNGTDNAFIRIDPAVRDRLKAHCEREGLIMGRFASTLITKALDDASRPPAESDLMTGRERPRRFLGRKTKPRRKAHGKPRRKAKAKK